MKPDKILYGLLDLLGEDNKYILSCGVMFKKYSSREKDWMDNCMDKSFIHE